MAHVAWECKCNDPVTRNGRTVVGAECLPASGVLARPWRACPPQEGSPTTGWDATLDIPVTNQDRQFGNLQLSFQGCEYYNRFKANPCIITAIIDSMVCVYNILYIKSRLILFPTRSLKDITGFLTSCRPPPEVTPVLSSCKSLAS